MPRWKVHDSLPLAMEGIFVNYLQSFARRGLYSTAPIPSGRAFDSRDDSCAVRSSRAESKGLTWYLLHRNDRFHFQPLNARRDLVPDTCEHDQIWSCSGNRTCIMSIAEQSRLSISPTGNPASKVMGQRVDDWGHSGCVGCLGESSLA